MGSHDRQKKLYFVQVPKRIYCNSTAMDWVNTNRL